MSESKSTPWSLSWDQAKSVYPSATMFQAGPYQFVLRAPNRGEFRRFQIGAMDEKRRVDEIENLVKVCVLFPDAVELERIIDTVPAIVMKLSDKVMLLAGAELDLEKKD